MKHINSFCMSSYLAFRYVPKKGYEWLPGMRPEFPQCLDIDQVLVESPDEILLTLKTIINDIQDIETTAIFLSGGIDSAILAALLPKGTHAYTIDFESKSSIKESEYAALYVNINELNHHIVTVSWDDYIKYETLLMKYKKSPLHAVEVALYKASKIAINDGIKLIILGNGADSTFGGLDKLLSCDWKFEDFVNRYTFINPATVLKTPTNIRSVYEPFRNGDKINFIKFLKQIHGGGIIQAFNNSLNTAGISAIEPYEKLQLKNKLDLIRIRQGEPKYLLVDVFKSLYPNVPVPKKIPFARPMDEWLLDYEGPISNVFRDDININLFTGEQKYLLHCLDKFVNLLERTILWT